MDAIVQKKGTLQIIESVIPMFPSPKKGDDDDPIIRMLLMVKKTYKRKSGVVISFITNRSDDTITVQSLVSCHDRKFEPDEIIKYREDFLHEATKVLNTFISARDFGHSLEESEHIAKEFAKDSIE